MDDDDTIDDTIDDDADDDADDAIDNVDDLWHIFNYNVNNLPAETLKCLKP